MYPLLINIKGKKKWHNHGLNPAPRANKRSSRLHHKGIYSAIIDGLFMCSSVHAAHSLPNPATVVQMPPRHALLSTTTTTIANRHPRTSRPPSSMPPRTRADATSTNRSGHIHKKSPPVPRKRSPLNASDQANKHQKQKHQDTPDELTPDGDDDDEEPKELKATMKPRGGKEEGGKKEAGKKKLAMKRVKKPRYTPPYPPHQTLLTQPFFLQENSCYEGHRGCSPWPRATREAHQVPPPPPLFFFLSFFSFADL